MRIKCFKLLVLSLTFLTTFTCISGTFGQGYEYYFQVYCSIEGEGYYGSTWDLTLNVQCRCIESSYFYEDITVYIEVYETYLGTEELTRTVSFFFGDMNPGESKTLSKTVKTKYPINNENDRENIRVEISDTVSFNKSLAGNVEDNNNPSQNEDKNLNTDLVGALIVLGVICVIGYVTYNKFFHKKEQIPKDSPVSKYNMLSNQVSRMSTHPLMQDLAKKQESAIATNQGVELFHLGRIHDAEFQYKKAVNLDHTNAVAWLNLGNIFQQTGRLIEAEEAYKSAVNSNSNRPDIWLGIVKGNKNLKRYDVALTTVNKALWIFPNEPNLLGWKGWILNDLRRYSESLQVFEKLVSVNPAEGLYGISCTNALIGNKERALEYLRKTLEVNPEYINRAKDDSDYESLRYDPEFRNLIKS